MVSKREISYAELEERLATLNPKTDFLHPLEDSLCRNDKKESCKFVFEDVVMIIQN